MHPMWILIPAAIAVALAVGAWRVRSERLRAEALLHWARMHGFEYQSKTTDLPFRTRLMMRMHGRVSNVLSKSEPGRRTILLDFRYTVGGKNRHTHRQTLAALQRDRRKLPAFELSPESVFHKIGDLFGWHDIDFEHRPEFSAKFLLRSEDEGTVRRFFNGTVLAYFEKHLGWSVETDGEWVVIYRADRRVRPEDLTEFLEDAEGIEGVLDAAAREIAR